MLIDVIASLLLLVVFWLFAVCILLIIVYGKQFGRLWREPMLSNPVVIFESDDWGVGPTEQVAALNKLSELLLNYQDRRQHHPVLTLGTVLAEPDVEKIKSDKQYYSRNLAANHYQDLVQVIKNGQNDTVFSIHLHGMEHFWPASLMSAIEQEDVRQWLFEVNDKERITENLPSFLQSRWCNTSSLPSVELDVQEIKKAITEEIKCFKKVFNCEPKVVVPPTFVWTQTVIEQYLLQKINVFVTPGRQFTGRDARGELLSNKQTFYSGEILENEATYLVRDIYFEPEMGHKAQRVLNDIVARTNCARASLIEIHRFNFLSNQQHAFEEFRALLDLISKQLPQTLFLSVEELVVAYQNNDYILPSNLKRFAIWVKRIRLFLQYKRVAKYSGINLFLNALPLDDY